MESTQAYFKEYTKIVETHLDLVMNLVSNGMIRQIAYEYSTAKQKQTKETFNVFKLASDLYYRENFHSDIIKAFLDPNEKHLEGNRFLFAFIDMLNNCFKKSISKPDFDDAVAVRERDKIDILVYSEKSKHCIIIENKIYNANDMPRQLPRYYDIMSKKGYEVDAIVYLPLEKKDPNTDGWNEDDKNNVEPRLCPLPAYTQDGNANLVDNWITPCSVISNDIDTISILRQYGELVKSLNYNIMDSIVLTKFYESLKEDDNLNTAISIRNMLGDIPILMADRLLERFRSTLSEYQPFKYKPNHCGIIFYYEKEEYRVDIWTRETGYDIYVFNFNDRTIVPPFSKTKVLTNFLQKEDGLTYFDFGIKDEQAVIMWAEELMNEIKKLSK